MGEKKNNLLNEFDNYIQTKRQNSLEQFKTRWEDIIARYSKPILNDDVVDLFTGEIIEDHGFIKSVKPLPFGSMVNAMDEGDLVQSNNKKDIKGKQKENEEDNNFVYDEDDFDNLLTPKKKYFTTSHFTEKIL
jgi:hypothetical protein